jgi:hypothetical protein
VCQDALHIHETSNYVVLCVADGHGSSSSPFSDEGAKIAANVANEIFTTILEQDLTMETMIAHKNLWLPKQIEVNWKEAVRKVHVEQGRDENEKIDYTLYGTTLLVFVATDSYVFSLQIGDGNMLMVDKKGEAYQILDVAGMIGEDTESLSMPESWQYMRHQIYPWNQTDGAPLFIITTDGYSKSFADITGFMQAGKEMFTLWNKEGLTFIANELPIWLEQSSDLGSGDDIALILAAYEVEPD